MLFKKVIGLMENNDIYEKAKLKEIETYRSPLPVSLYCLIIIPQYNVWQCETLYDYIRLCIIMYDYMWISMIIYDKKWLCMAIYDYLSNLEFVYLCLTLFTFVYLCLSLFTFVQLTHLCSVLYLFYHKPSFILSNGWDIVLVIVVIVIFLYGPVHFL